MTDVISRSAVLDRLEMLRRNYTLKAGYRDAMTDAIGEVRDALTIDAEPVRHGQWIFGELGPVGCDVNCSECGWGAKNVDPVMWLDYDGHKHCGCCGAKMDGENAPEV